MKHFIDKNSFNTSNQTLNSVLRENRKSREKKNITTNDSESIKCINIAINTCVNKRYFEYEWHIQNCALIETETPNNCLLHIHIQYDSSASLKFFSTVLWSTVIWAAFFFESFFFFVYWRRAVNFTTLKKNANLKVIIIDAFRLFT